MSSSKLPPRPSLEYLKKLAKDRLQEMRRGDPSAKLAGALLAVARDHGFASWRALKSEVERLRADTVAQFFTAAANADLDRISNLLSRDASLARAVNPAGQYGGWTALHEAAKRGQSDAVRLLLDHGADPNAREAGDNTYPLHWAAAHGHVEIARALLDAGGDVHGFGDDHEWDTIGWATGGLPAEGSLDVVALLVERGARHHIFSAISVGDLNLIQKLVEENPDALDRRTSRHEQRQTALHFAIEKGRYDILELLIELGADLEAGDASGQTALGMAMLRGDREAMTRLHAAGAKPPEVSVTGSVGELAGSVHGLIPAIAVPDIGAALDWYTAIGFEEVGRYEDEGVVNWGMVALGKARIMFGMHGKAGPHDMSLWFETDQVDRLYQLLKARQLEAAEASLAGKPGNYPPIEFVQDIYDPFYGGREFGIRDLNGYVLYFRRDG
jgi:ankyrin repeat protein